MRAKNYKLYLTAGLAAILIAVVALTQLDVVSFGDAPTIEKVKSTGSAKASVEMKKARYEYFHRMYRDPKTDVIPADALSKDQAFYNKHFRPLLQKAKEEALFDWNEAGPYDVGGRTRALAVDVTDGNTIIAGGVSGGIWKSTDKGDTWELKSAPDQHRSVTAVEQDIRPGHTNVWYYCAGEWTGNSASGSGGAFYRGEGVYKSIDNGETWSKIVGTGTTQNWDEPSDYAFNVKVNPVTGSVFLATRNYGLFKSVDGGATFNETFGATTSDHEFVDLDISADGKIVAVFSSAGSGSPSNNPGVYLSTNDGASWTEITPASFPANHTRSVLAIAPSNTNVCYILTNTDQNKQSQAGTSIEDHRFHKISLQAPYSSTDLSANMPDFSTSTASYGPQGTYNSQGGYNMVISVKPDDEDFIMFGGTNLYRSFDGMSTPIDDDRLEWIGGYHKTDFNYLGLHADVHSFAWDPDNPNELWIGTDGGLSFTVDITTTNFSSRYPWISKNNGYNVTQFYHLSIPMQEGDERLMGGTQDNGTPYFRYDGNQATGSKDVSSGDGSYSAFTNAYAYTSSQFGRVLRVGYESNGDVVRAFDSGESRWSDISPPAYSNGDIYLFVNPFVISPANQNLMYYAASQTLWQNATLSSIPENENGTIVGWKEFDDFTGNGYTVPATHVITALAFSTQNSTNVLYYAGYDAATGTGAPVVYRVNNALTTRGTDAVDVSPTGADGGSYPTNIAVNPKNSDEVLVTFSNYNVKSLFYTNDGGSTWTNVEGNLVGVPGDEGPSFRCATIVELDNGEKVYLVGTSIGLYAARSLNGDNTMWVQEAPQLIGNTVIQYLASRSNDGRVVAATHGRGAFEGYPSSVLEVKDITNELPQAFALEQNYPNPFNPSTKIRFSVPKANNVTLKVYDIKGELVSELVNEFKNVGTYEATWNGRNQFGSQVASGTYVYTLQAGDLVESKKMILLK